MLVHKLVFFCWLVATCFGEAAETINTQPPTTTLKTDTTESSTATSTSPLTSTTQTPADTSTTSKTSEITTTPGQESSSTTSSTTVTESSTATSTSTPTSTTQTPADTLTTSKPSEITTTPGQESSTTTSSTIVTESSTATSTSPPTSTTQTPADTSTTSKPSEITTTPGQESSTTTSSTTVTESSTATSTSTPTSTTQTPADTSTTSKPSEITTTPGQDSSTTTSSTTVTGSSTATSTSLPTSTTTGTETTNNTTPGEPSTTTTTVPTTTKPPACSSNPCPFDSICVELFDGFTCQCFAGSFLFEGSCRKAKVFAGDLRLTDQLFEEGMKDTGSKIFLETATNIQTALKAALGNDSNYIESKVLQLRNGSIIATVDNIYKTTSTLTPTSFDTAFNKSVQQCGNDCAILQKSTFSKVDLCMQKPAPCDVDTTTCKNNDGNLNCVCKPGYIRSTFSSRSCSACPSGQKIEKGMCVPCSFGYSGFNCNDSNLLAVVVISCVLGALLLITLLAFTIYGCRTKPKDYSSPYPPAQETRTTWTNSNVPKIPRASANINAQWDSPNLEMMESGSTRALVAKDRPGNGVMGPYSGMKTFAGSEPSPYYGRDNPRFIGDYERGTR
ncbi:mucin-13-like isoform X1 [Anguilla rostrata]|uniref:mucin-13-like isoform X1 n=1 Tax=Anguilla rostrata TaxID=7938 RepID=UPI0030D4E39B